MNLALIGFMGTGKSSVGRLVSQNLAYEHVDTDTWIETLHATSIRHMFQTEGEPVFRAREHNVTVSLELRTKLVISTGGGLVLDARNRYSLRKHACIICLTASPETILQRVSGHGPRPLLETADPLTTIRRLLETRKPAYEDADWTVDTEGKTVEEVVETVLRGFWQHRREGHHR